jgi:flagellar motor switch protein FliG
LPTVAAIAGLLAFARWALPAVLPPIEAYLERASIAQTSHAVAGFAPAQVRLVLEDEPPHAAAAIISALPAATAAAVLELYPPYEREAIVARMARAHSPLIPDAAEYLGRRA